VSLSNFDRSSDAQDHVAPRNSCLELRVDCCQKPLVRGRPNKAVNQLVTMSPGRMPRLPSCLHSKWRRSSLVRAYECLEARMPFAPRRLDVAAHRGFCITVKVVSVSDCCVVQRQYVGHGSYSTTSSRARLQSRLVSMARIFCETRGIHVCLRKSRLSSH
jgi:hypothetical protein